MGDITFPILTPSLAALPPASSNSPYPTTKISSELLLFYQPLQALQPILSPPPPSGYCLPY